MKGGNMKVLSLLEPWASLIKENKKKIETRSWKTSYRGELYIHASQKPISKTDPAIQKLLEYIPNVEMAYGQIICKCNLVDCIEMTPEWIEEVKKDKQEFACGEYAIGRYGWILEDIEVLTPPIPAKGHLQIWNYKAN